ncbi:unnamed protein product [Acanthoscelides obtectus]|uniref:MoaB/Mog domain-containing protein n=1 Tax=Acanthoscelides obtectus TaxID=200917 RepID=A0A9P0LFQ7_ACAOB|nr:unnamed protein product [Acanthoscelides obtectus]CAK1646516.1 FAD synthase [Acanthoscelides obtectus]
MGIKVPFIFRKTIFRLLCTTRDAKSTTAGIIVIGDEILKGQVVDTNSSYLALELHKLGLQLKKISVIGDNVKEICDEVRCYSDSYDYVLTTGGIGPTHDDVTYEGVALAFNAPLVLDPELRDICMNFYKTNDVNAPGMKLAKIPKSAKLTFKTLEGVRMVYPNVSIKNVYIFPGIPQLLRKSFGSLKTVLFKSNRKFYTKAVYLTATEESISKLLGELAEDYPDVQFGSYPTLQDIKYKVKVTIESHDEKSTEQAHNKLKELMPEEYIVHMEDDS